MGARRTTLASRSAIAASGLALAALSSVACGAVDVSPSDDAAAPAAEVTDEIVGCATAADPGGDAPAIDLGSIVVGPVADAERVGVDGGTEIRFVVEVEARAAVADADEASDAADAAGLVDPSALAILQARVTDDTLALLSVDAAPAAGADRPAAAAALSFERCETPVRHEVVLLVTQPGCLVLVGNDPVTGGFTELPVRVDVDGCAPAGPPVDAG